MNRSLLRIQHCVITQKTVASAKPRIVFTGIQPTGNLHIGNYLGSIQSILNIQNQNPHKLYLSIVDHHSLTTRFTHDHGTPQTLTPGVIRSETLQMAAALLACGIDPRKTVLFVQSAVPQHCELAWILSCIAPQNWLNTMIQYKQKSNKNSSLGLYSYPVLMSADILLYKANEVPVGEDQKQHIELTQRYTSRFNSFFGDGFFESPSYISSPAPRIMSLIDGNKKMSKSEHSDKSRINLSDSKQVIANKIIKAKTDSISEFVTYEPEKRPEVSNLLTIYAALEGITTSQAETKFRGVRIVEFKKQIAEDISAKVGSISQNLKQVKKDEGYVKQILRAGALRAREQAAKTMLEVKKHMGMYSI